MDKRRSWDWWKGLKKKLKSWINKFFVVIIYRIGIYFYILKRNVLMLSVCDIIYKN